MAVTLLKHYERFAGLSTDVKPANAPMGSTFFEWDTSKLYTLSPAGWVEKKGTIHGDVQLSGSKVTDITFHNAAVAAADGTALTLNGEKTLTVEILSTATSFTIAFIGEGPSGADIPLMGVNLTDLSTAINTSTSGQLWQFDITGLTKVFMDLTAVTAGAGSVTVKGRAVA